MSYRPEPAHPPGAPISLRPNLDPSEKVTAVVDEHDFPKAVTMYAELTGRNPVPDPRPALIRLDDALGHQLTRFKLIAPFKPLPTGITYHRDGSLSVIELKERLEDLFHRAGLQVVTHGKNQFRVVPEGKMMGARRSV